MVALAVVRESNARLHELGPGLVALFGKPDLSSSSLPPTLTLGFLQSEAPVESASTPRKPL